MTWYWWTHWFWITSMWATYYALPITSVDNLPISFHATSKVYNKRDPLKFPVPVQSDTEDVMDGDTLLATPFMIKSDWINPLTLHVDSIGTDNSSATPETTTIGHNTNGIANNTTETNKSAAVTIGDKLSENKSSTTPTITTTEWSNATAEQSNTTEMSAINSTVMPDVRDELKEIAIGEVTTVKAEIVLATTDLLNASDVTVENDLLTLNANDHIDYDRDRGRQSKILAEFTEEIKILNITPEESKSLLNRVPIDEPLLVDGHIIDGHLASEALQIQRRASILGAGAVSGICFAVLGLFCAASFVSVAIYRRRYINKPRVLSEPDSSGYIDDSTIKDNSDEMYSLDNDSFLNSLEAMTIQNYWTDNVKHTKL